LMAPSQCLPGQGASLSPFLDPTQYKAETRRGYQFRFIAGPPPAPGVADPARVSRTGLTRYAYVATPSQADRSGVKTICGDASGRVCVMASPSSPELEQGTCPTTDCLDLP
jgi:hypothetical protein